MTVNIGAGNIAKIRLAEQGSDPATPASGYGYLYEKSGGDLYFINDAGDVKEISRDIGARVYNSVDLTIPNSTITPLTFDSERYDTDGIHSTVSNTGRLTCITAGKYLISANISFAANSTGNRLIYLTLNGTTDIGVVLSVANADTVAIGTISTVYELAVNDYVSVSVLQTSGGDLDVLSTANYSPESSMQKIG